jgi:hypothetical protein
MPTEDSCAHIHFNSMQVQAAMKHLQEASAALATTEQGFAKERMVLQELKRRILELEVSELSAQ